MAGWVERLFNKDYKLFNNGISFRSFFCLVKQVRGLYEGIFGHKTFS